MPASDEAPRRPEAAGRSRPAAPGGADLVAARLRGSILGEVPPGVFGGRPAPPGPAGVDAEGAGGVRAAAPAATPADVLVAGVAPAYGTAAELVLRLEAEGEELRGSGFLLGLAGLADEEVSAPGFGESGGTRTVPARARFALAVRARVVARARLGSVAALTARGEIGLSLVPGGGGPGDPAASAPAATPLARWAVRLLVQTPVAGPGSAGVLGELCQEEAGSFVLGERVLRLGRPGLRARLLATGTADRPGADDGPTAVEAAGTLVTIAP